MRLQDLREMQHGLNAIHPDLMDRLRRRCYKTTAGERDLSLALDQVSLLKAELRMIIRVLERVLQVSKRALQGEVRQDCKLRQLLYRALFGGTVVNAEECDGDDPQDPHSAIAEMVAAIAILSDPLKVFMGVQEGHPDQRHPRLGGTRGLLERVRICREVEHDDGTVQMIPRWQSNEMLGSLSDQFEGSMALILQICQERGPLEAVVYLIRYGMSDDASALASGLRDRRSFGGVCASHVLVEGPTSDVPSEGASRGKCWQDLHRGTSMDGSNLRR
jgi:hypothetical protein